MEPVLPPEPPVAGSWPSSLAAWVRWFGPARLVTSALAVVVVCAGLFWLLRTSPPPTEAGLPVATSVRSSTTTATVGPTEPPGPVSVHVAGAVEHAGVYELPAGARVHAAIEAAGGATTDADVDLLNLAAAVVDGSRVYVPEVGEALPAAAPTIVSAIDGVSEATVGGAPAGTHAPIDVNRASVAELDLLPGVGPATAAAIVTERDRNGPFLSVDDLTRVRGIGPAKLDALRELITT